MMLTITPEKTFNCPPGTYLATLAEARSLDKPTKRGSETLLRLVFEINPLSTPYKTVLAGKNYVPTLNPGSELRHDLDGWLGEDFFEQASSPLNPQSLVGRQANVTVTHIINSGYKRPYVSIASMRPATTTAALAYRDAQEGI